MGRCCARDSRNASGVLRMTRNETDNENRGLCVIRSGALWEVGARERMDVRCFGAEQSFDEIVSAAQSVRALKSLKVVFVPSENWGEYVATHRLMECAPQ